MGEGEREPGLIHSVALSRIAMQNFVTSRNLFLRRSLSDGMRSLKEEPWIPITFGQGKQPQPKIIGIHGCYFCHLIPPLRLRRRERIREVTKYRVAIRDKATLWIERAIERWGSADGRAKGLPHYTGAMYIWRPHWGGGTQRWDLNLCMWLGEVSSCSCLIFLPGPAWVLLNKICKD